MDALDQVITAYRSQPTDRLISDVIILTSDEGIDALRQAKAATLGYSRSGYYLDTARSLMRQMMTDVDEISWRMDAYALMFGELNRDHSSIEEFHEKAGQTERTKLGALCLSVQAEIFWHFYAASLQHAWYFMKHCTQAIDAAFVFKPEEQDYLTLIQAFRNHMEHRDKAAGDVASDDWPSMSRDEQKSTILGYRRDRENNISFVPATGLLKGTSQKMPMNPDGFDRFETMFIDIYERLRTACITKLKTYFLEHPDKLPSPDQVGGTLTEHLTPVDENE